MDFDTKIVLTVRDDLLLWQKLNVTAFLTSGIVGTDTDLIGASYEEADRQQYRPMLIQPIIVLESDLPELRRTRRRAVERGFGLALYIEDMFNTGHDAANRESVSRYGSDNLGDGCSDQRIDTAKVASTVG